MTTRITGNLLAAALACATLLGNSGGSASAAPQAARPNIIFILADDLGYTDLACYGSKFYETPHIDRLAAQGMRFTHGYTCGPNCQPTRAALLTGQYGPRTGVYTVGGTDRFDTSMRPLVPVENVVNLPLGKTTVAQALQQTGYATGMFGKWHLGNKGAHHPARRGFDEAIESAGRHFDFSTDPKTDVPAGAYLADWLTDRALDFIQRHRDRPFFLYLPHFGVHAPHQAKKELIERFASKPAAGGHRNPTYAAMIASVDQSVGRILTKLDELQLATNTLVLFSSDNGGVGGYVAAGVKAKEGVTDNAPLRGGKGMLYEGGVRVPWIARWPGRIKAGAESDEPVISVDLFPTFLELARGSGATVKDQALDGVSLEISRRPGATVKDQALDGKSLVPLLTGAAEKLQRDGLYWHFPGYLGSGKDIWRTTPAGAIRVGDYKLLEFFEEGRLELYNLRDDVGQKRDLAREKPELTRELHAKLKAWRAQVNAPMPTRREGL